MKFIILSILIIIFNTMDKGDKGVTFKEMLGYIGGAAAASYGAGFASGKLSGEQYAKGFQDGHNNK